jgi:hypothetical protein
MYVMQITGTRAVKTSASSTRRQLRPHRKREQGRANAANGTGQTHTNEGAQTKMREDARTRTGGSYSRKREQGRANANRQMRPGKRTRTRTHERE